MAYERSWQFLAPVGPRIAAATPTPVGSDALGYRSWLLKAFLKGETGGATQGLWTCYGSSDGATFSLNDGVDRWGNTFDVAKTVYASNTGGPRSWIILTNTFGGIQVWFTISLGGPSNANTISCFFSGSAPTGGNLTTNPTTGVLLGGNLNADMPENLLTDTTNARKYYGAMTTTGDFWFAETITGEVASMFMFQKPVGTKSNDQWPFFCRYMPNSQGYFLFSACGASIYSMNNSSYPIQLGKFYNGGVGRVVLNQPFSATSTPMTDAADVSLFDFPAWVLVGNADTPTQMHSRGRLADTGICCGISGPSNAGAHRPVNVGTTIKDGANVAYATFNQLIVPYNALVS